MTEIEQKADNGSLKGLVYKRKFLNPSRLKGLGAFASTLGIYTYLPLLSAYVGSTVPMFGACLLAVYGMNAFSLQSCVNTIGLIQDDNYHIRITYSDTPFSSRSILVNVKHVQSVLSLSNDDLGQDDVESNILSINEYYDENIH